MNIFHLGNVKLGCWFMVIDICSSVEQCLARLTFGGKMSLIIASSWHNSTSEQDSSKTLKKRLSFQIWFSKRYLLGVSYCTRENPQSVGGSSFGIKASMSFKFHLWFLNHYYTVFLSSNTLRTSLICLGQNYRWIGYYIPPAGILRYYLGDISVLECTQNEGNGRWVVDNSTSFFVGWKLQAAFKCDSLQFWWYSRIFLCLGWFVAGSTRLCNNASLLP